MAATSIFTKANYPSMALMNYDHHERGVEFSIIVVWSATYDVLSPATILCQRENLGPQLCLSQL